MKKELNANEQEFVKNIKDLTNCVPEGYELEMEHFPGGDDCPAGWYAYKYSETYGEATPMDDYNEPIITDNEADERQVDVVKCCNVANVYCA